MMLRGDVVVVVGHHSATSENATTKPLHLLFIFIYMHTSAADIMEDDRQMTTTIMMVTRHQI